MSSTLNPHWAKFSVKLRNLCQLDVERKIQFDFKSWFDNGHHRDYGKLETSLSWLTSGENSYQLNLQGKKISAIEIDAKVVERPSFMDFL